MKFFGSILNDLLAVCLSLYPTEKRFLIDNCDTVGVLPLYRIKFLHRTTLIKPLSLMNVGTCVRITFTIGVYVYANLHTIFHQTGRWNMMKTHVLSKISSRLRFHIFSTASGSNGIIAWLHIILLGLRKCSLGVDNFNCV